MHAVVGSQFPPLAGGPVAKVGEGWDNEVFAVGDEWWFRFPKRRTCVPAFERELRVMDVVGPALGALVPAFELLGAPSERFPYPFAGYRPIAGVAADASEVLDRRALAAALGPHLGAIHAIDAGTLPPTPGGWEEESWDRPRLQVVEAAPVIAEQLGPLVLAAEPYLRGAVPAPSPVPRSARRFVHGDICPDHLIVDPVTGALRGVLDFADAMAGDPVLDFVGLVPLGGAAFVADVVSHYPHPLDDGFGDRLAWLTRTLTLRWLADAVAEDGDVAKHVRWVERAFAGGAAGGELR